MRFDGINYWGFPTSFFVLRLSQEPVRRREMKNERPNPQTKIH